MTNWFRCSAIAAVAGIALNWVVGSGVKAAALSFTIYDTGVDNDESALPVQTPDPHWLVNGNTAYIAAPNPAWMPRQPSAGRWLNPLSVPASGSVALPAMTYSYTQVFDLTGFDPSSVVLSGFFSSDNDAEIFLNGVSTGIISPLFSASYQDPVEQFSLTTGFQSGMNTIEFRVQNFFLNSNRQIANYNPSPSGLYVRFLNAEANPATQSAPEPGTLVALGMATTGIWVTRRKRRYASGTTPCGKM